MKYEPMDQLPVLFAAEIQRKKRFWQRTMWISLTLGMILAVGIASCCAVIMKNPSSALEQSGSVVLASNQSDVLKFLVTSLPTACLAFLLAMVSFIRLLSLPREPKR